MSTDRARTLAAPPLGPDVWWKRLCLLLSTTLLFTVWGTLVIWACVEDGDWRSTYDGGDEKLLVFAVGCSVGIPFASATKLVRSLPQIATARRRTRGRLMTAVPYVEDREHEGAYPWSRVKHSTHWWLSLRPIGTRIDAPPDLALKVSERCAASWPQGATVALYGERPGRDRWAVVALGDTIVWPTAQETALPESSTRL